MELVRQRRCVLSASALSETQARLAVRLVEFNMHVARFAHRSWYGRDASTQISNANVFDACGKLDTRAESHISEWLLRELDLYRAMDWEMSEPEKRLWLLDGASLERLAQELALTMHREWLLQVIDARRLRALESSVSERALHFVIEEVPQGQFHYGSPAVSFEIESSAVLGTKLKEAGARTLMALLQPAWRAVRGRAQLYFDRSQKLDDVTPFEAAHRDQALELICGWLLPRRFPEWGWCF